MAAGRGICSFGLGRLQLQSRTSRRADRRGASGSCCCPGTSRAFRNEFPNRSHDFCPKFTEGRQRGRSRCPTRPTPVSRRFVQRATGQGLSPDAFGSLRPGDRSRATRRSQGASCPPTSPCRGAALNGRWTRSVDAGHRRAQARCMRSIRHVSRDGLGNTTAKLPVALE
jgi:hypothetical protein